jgi:GWxTD domain-containing protein
MSTCSRRFLGTVVLFILALAVQAQTTLPLDPLKIAVDFARFRYDEQDTYVEFYYSFAQRSLTYVPDKEGFKAGIEITISVVRKDSLVFADRLLVPHVAKDTGATAVNLISMSNARLADGDYILKVVARDVNNRIRADSTTQRLNVRAFPANKLALSDIQFASSIKKGKQGSLFYKNTLDVVPNADGLYSGDQNCYFYAEAYNLFSGEEKGDFIMKTGVYNAIGKELISRERPRKRSGESTVLVDNFEVSNLRSGTYTLVISLLDSARKPMTSSGKKFFVYNAVLGVDSSMMRLDPSIALSVFATMEEPDLDREFKWTKWESQELERDQYDGLKGVAAKRKFLTEFWSKRAPGARDQYLTRVAYANSNFRVLGSEGVRTDRGRVHVMYGAPDDIERHPNESGTRPYEIWTYNNIQGGVVFVFVLRQNGGDYELVHSTHRNELHDENWGRYAQTN